MIPTFLAAFACIPFIWKGVPVLLSRAIRHYLSRSPSLGFSKLISIWDTSLTSEALLKVTAFLRTSVPVELAGLHVGQLKLQTGPWTGINIFAKDVEVTLQMLEEERWEDASDDVCKRQLKQSGVDAQKALKSVQNALSKKPSTTTKTLYKVLNRFLGKARVDVRQLRIVIVHGTGTVDSTITGKLALRSSDVIEKGGLGLHLTAEVGCKVDAAELLRPLPINIVAGVPRLATLLLDEPGKAVKRKVDANVVVGNSGASSTTSPASVGVLLGLGKVMQEFSTWRQKLCDEAELSRVPLRASDIAEYTKALSQGKRHLEQWESRMSTAEILSFYSRQYHWPIPEGSSVEDWVEELSKQQRILQGLLLTISLFVGELTVSVLGNSLAQGDGYAVSLKSITLNASTMPSAPTSATEGGDGVVAQQASSARAKLSLECRGLMVTCEDPETSARQIVEPLQVCVELTSRERRAGIFLVALDVCLLPEETDSMNLLCIHNSGRSIWKALRLIDAYADTVPQLNTVTDEVAAETRARDARRLHDRDVRALFRRVDTTCSGTLEEEEVHALVTDLYGGHMTEGELEEAAKYLFAQIDVDGTGMATLENLRNYFAKPSRFNRRLLLRYWEFARPLPENFDMLQCFADEVLRGRDPTQLYSTKSQAIVFQKRWVRALGNYATAKTVWEALLAPTLKLPSARWRLTGQEVAVDFWSDPFLSVREKFKAEQQGGTRVELSVSAPGTRITFAASQHCICVPQVFIQCTDFSMSGSVTFARSSAVPDFKNFRAMWALAAECKNSRYDFMEPCVEPLVISISGDGKTISMSTDSHAVINVTPSLLRMMKAIIAPLRDTRRDPERNRLEVPADNRIAALISSSLGIDLVARVCDADGHCGPESFVSSGELNKLVTVSLPDTFEAHDCQLEISVPGEGHKVKVRISDAGIVSFKVGSHSVLVSVSYFPEVLAPVVRLGGLVRFRNQSVFRLVYRDATKLEVPLEPHSDVALPKSVTHGEVRLLLNSADEDSLPIAELADELHGRHKPGPKQRQGQKVAGFRLNILKLPDPAGTEIVFVPGLRVLNALPSSVNVAIQHFKGTALTKVLELVPGTAMSNELCSAAHAELESKKVVLQPGSVMEVTRAHTWGLQEQAPLDVDKSLILALTLEETSYVVIFNRARFSTRRRALRGSGRPVSTSLTSADAGSPRLDVMIDWRDRTAILTIYARFWVANKTSKYNIEAAVSGAKLEPESVRATQVKGLLWSTKTVTDIVIHALEPKDTLKELDVTSETDELEDGDSDLKEQGDAETFANVEKTGRGQMPIPEIALLRAHTDKISLRVASLAEDGSWSWDARVHGRLGHWPPLGHDAQIGWSRDVIVSVANTTSSVSMSNEASHGYIPELARLSGTPALTFGVSINNLPEPFSNTKLITVTPRYILRNGLGKSIVIWPEMRAGRKAPAENESPGDLPMVKPGGSLAIDTVPQGEGSQAGKLATVCMCLAPDRMSSSTQEQIREQGSGSVGMQWSTCVPVDAVGETILALHPPAGSSSSDFLLVRATVQLMDATLFILLNRTEWPYSLENRSSDHTVVFRQKGTEKEFNVGPLASQPFIFPDPDQREVVVARIRGAGEHYEVEYDLKDLVNTELPTIQRPGTHKGLPIPALQARVSIKGTTCVLSLSDPVPQEQRERYRKAAPSGTSSSEDFYTALGLDVFAPGLHLTLVDTFARVPQEMLAVTVDYIQVEKACAQVYADFQIHHVQIDDMGVEDMFIFGPSSSGFNSHWQASGLVTASAAPWLRMRLRGPRDVEGKFFDTENRIVTVDLAALVLQPMEVHVNVPRFVQVALRAASWVDDSGGLRDLSTIPQADLAQRALAKALSAGFTVPTLGRRWLFNIGCLDVESLAMNIEIVMSDKEDMQRKIDESELGDDEDEEDVERQAEIDRQLKAFTNTLPGAVQTLVSALALPAGSLADLSPRVRISPFVLENTLMSMGPVITSMSRHYTQQVLQQWYSILGSIQVLGDPASLINDVGGGISRAVHHAMALELSSGAYDLLDGVVGGFFSSLSKMSGVAKDVSSSILGKKAGVADKAMSLEEGVELGMVTLTDSVSLALEGVLVDPFNNADHSLQFAKSAARGTAGILLRPMEGLFGAVEKVTQGIEGSIRYGGHRYYGLRRPPRASFRDRSSAAALQPLNQGMFWPEWSLKVHRIRLPALWHEPSVKSLMVSLGSAGSIHKEPCIQAIRGLDGQWDIPSRRGEEQTVTGRVGILRGPFQIKVEAELEGNVGLTKPIRMTVARGVLSSKVLTDILDNAKSTESRITFKLEAVGSQALGLFSLSAGEALGEVVVDLSKSVDYSILPARIVPGLGQSGQRRSTKAIEDEMEEELTMIRSRRMSDVSRRTFSE